MPHPLAPGRPWPRRLLDQIHDQKYSLTLGIILLAHIGLAALPGRQAMLIAPPLTLLLYFVGFILMRDYSRLARVLLFTGLGALAVSGVSLLSGNLTLLVTALVGYTVFLFLLIVFLLLRIFRVKRVSLDLIMAGIIVYLLVAGFWAQLFSLLVLADPGAIHVAGGSFGNRPFLTFYYFSLTTLTTAGFGDIVPVSDIARILAAYESLVGQVYLVVFIALLMGRHFAEK